MKIKEYWRELQIRLVYIILSLVITLIYTYQNAWHIIDIVARPLERAHNLTRCAAHEETSASTYKHEASDIIDLVQQPFHFILTEVSEAFWAITELSLILTIFLIIPFLSYQIWLYIKPGLYQYEKNVLRCAFALYLFFWFLSLLLTYYFLLPATCKFFLGIVTAAGGGAANHLSDNAVDLSTYTNMDATQSNVSFATQVQMNLEAKIGNYLKMVEKTFVTSHLFCEIPLILWLRSSPFPAGCEARPCVHTIKQPLEGQKHIGKIEQTSRDKLVSDKIACIYTNKRSLLDLENYVAIQREKTNRPFYYILIIGLCGFITPPDVSSQILIIIPLILFFEITRIYFFFLHLFRTSGTIDRATPSHKQLLRKQKSLRI